MVVFVPTTENRNFFLPKIKFKFGKLDQRESWLYHKLKFWLMPALDFNKWTKNGRFLAMSTCGLYPFFLNIAIIQPWDLTPYILAITFFHRGFCSWVNLQIYLVRKEVFQWVRSPTPSPPSTKGMALQSYFTELQLCL